MFSNGTSRLLELLYWQICKGLKITKCLKIQQKGCEKLVELKDLKLMSREKRKQKREILTQIKTKKAEIIALRQKNKELLKEILALKEKISLIKKENVEAVKE